MADGFFESTQVKTTDLRNMLKNFKEATFTHGGVASTIKGVFINKFEAVDFGLTDVESSSPFFMACDADVTGVAHADTLAIVGITYKVTGVQPDGTGVTLLKLSQD